MFGVQLNEIMIFAFADVTGKVIHVVERPPPSMRQAGSSSERPPRQSTGAQGGPSGVSIGAFTIPEVVDPNHIQVRVQSSLFRRISGFHVLPTSSFL